MAYVIDAPDLLRLLYRHAETGGKVTRHIPDSHGMVEIGYSIGGTPYRRAVPRFGAGLSWVVGDAVPVYYDPDDPAVAFTAPAAEILEAERPAWIGASMLGSVFGIVLALRILRIRE